MPPPERRSWLVWASTRRPASTGPPGRFWSGVATSVDRRARRAGRTFQTGDRIVLYGRSVAGSAGPGGTTGNVVGVDPHRGRVLVAWDRGGPAAVLDRTGLAHAGYAYAATPGMAGRMIHHRNSPVLLLGSTDSVPLLQRRVLASARAVAGLEPGRGRRLAAQSHLERQTRVPDLGL